MSIKFFSLPRVKGATLSETWYIEWDQWHPIEQRTKRIRKSFNLNRIKSLADRQQMAKHWLREVRDKVPAGYPWEDLQAVEATGEETIRQAYADVLEIRCVGARFDTIKTYKSVVKGFMAWLKMHQLDERAIGSLSKGICQRYLDSIIKRGLSATSYNNNLRVLKGFASALVEREVCAANPWKSLKYKPKVPGERNRFSASEMRDLIAWMSEHDRDLLAYIMLMLYSGLRITELRRIRIGELDLKTGLATIDKAVAKKNKKRQSTIPSKLLPFLNSRVTGFGKINFMFGQALKPGPEPVSHTLAYRRHCKAMKEAHVQGKGLTLNSWRHTAASIFIEQFDQTVAQRQMGHASPDTTRIYAKPSPFIGRVSRMDVEGL